MSSSSWWTKLVEARKGPRLPGGGLTAFYWTGGLSGAHAVREISLSGAVIETPDRYSPGTLIHLVLGRIAGEAPVSPAGSFDLWARVVRQEPNALCVKFLIADRTVRDSLRCLLNAPGEKSRVSKRAGESLLEFAIVFPVLILPIVNVLSFGRLLDTWIK